MSRLKSSERRMKLILILQDSKKRLTVDELAETFGVSRRTIFRDFNVLSEINVPVTWDKYSGYGVMEGYKVPPLMFTAQELATIMVGLNFVKSQVDKQLVDDAKGVELKIKNTIPDELKEFMSSLDDRTVVDPFLHFGHEKKEGGNWYLVSSAISQSKSLGFSYLSKSENEITERTIDPYLLVFYRDHWNVIGFSHKREAIRNFVLDRMDAVKILDKKFARKTEMDVEGLIFGSNESGQLVEVLVNESADRAFRANLPTKIFKQNPVSDKKNKVGFHFENLDYINEWLLQFGNKVEILSPEELKQKRKKILASMMKSL
ncbi:helix-turn-helix transcriptional regulator [Rhodohalobacter sp. 614A]|uniref:helix-turn-helix transcriptional regulator n=1 Tax=Rhodohalobacter sp. 614A TaxID=2908649 RepID=UPI001F357B14|nr:YafY family protein [Rhodohalobacter sp. 614A]